MTAHQDPAVLLWVLAVVVVIIALLPRSWFPEGRDDDED